MKSNRAYIKKLLNREKKNFRKKFSQHLSNEILLKFDTRKNNLEKKQNEVNDLLQEHYEIQNWLVDMLTTEDLHNAQLLNSILSDIITDDNADEIKEKFSKFIMEENGY